MKKHKYHVEIWGDYETTGVNPSSVRDSLVHVLKHKGHDVVNFEIKVERVIESKYKPSDIDIAHALDKLELDKTPRGRGKMKVAGKKPRNTARKAATKKAKGKTKRRVKGNGRSKTS